jgi:hypothetical protein
MLFNGFASLGDGGIREKNMSCDVIKKEKKYKRKQVSAQINGFPGKKEGDRALSRKTYKGV